MEEMVVSSKTKNTITQYSNIWLSVQMFINILVMPVTLPLSVCTIVRFLAFKFSEGMASSTLCSHISVISFVHKVSGIPDPTHHFLVKSVLIGAQRLGPTVHQLHGITFKILIDLISVVSA